MLLSLFVGSDYFLLITLLTFFPRSVTATGTSSSPIVQLSDGTALRGSQEGNVATFKGIRYAEPPVNERRWTPPVSWTNPYPDEEYDATRFGHTCIQWLWGDDGLFDEGDEDCLFLNVYVILNQSLIKNQNQQLPVSIFVHGGSYITGGTAIPLYDGVDLVEFWEGNVILVTTNYRLNIFGFLGSEELRSEDENHQSTGNYGLQDQRLAFDWVRRNIASFGGNPKHVTIFGESAGAGSMTNHLVAPKSWGLFNAVVLESGSFAEWASISMTCAQDNYDRILNLTGCKAVDCLRKIPATILRDIGGSNQKSCGYGPVVDGVELMTHPWIALANGDIADVPILHGTNSDEGSLFTVLRHHCTKEQLHAYWADYGYSDSEIDQLDVLYVDGIKYPPTTMNNSLFWWAGQRSLGDDFMSCPAKYASQQVSQLIMNGNHTSRLFLYHFEHLPRGQSLVRHVSELEYVFHQKELLPDPPDMSMADIMSTYWGNFFSTYDPNIERVGIRNLQQWTSYDIVDDNLLAITDATNLRMVTGVKRVECDFIIPRLDGIIRKEFN